MIVEKAPVLGIFYSTSNYLYKCIFEEYIKDKNTQELIIMRKEFEEYLIDNHNIKFKKSTIYRIFKTIW